MDSIQDTPYALVQNAPSAPSSFSWNGFIFTFLVLIGILLLVLWVIRRINQQSTFHESSWLRVIDKQSLNQHPFYLVEIAGKIYVMAITSHHAEVISEINDSEMMKDILQDIATRPIPAPENFLQKLGPILKPRGFAKELEKQLKHR